MQVRIVRMDDFGRGICYVDDKITFVPNSLTDDLLDIEITKETKKYNIGKIKKVLETKEKESPCPYSNECGGCSLLRMEYSNTLDFKKQKLENLFKKFGKLELNIPIIASPKPLEYRNKITLHVVNGLVGLYKEETNEVIKIEECKLIPFKVNEFIKLIPSFKINNGTVVIRTNFNMELFG